MGARGGVRGEPGPGVGPAAPLSVVPLFEIGAGGALRSRDGASPIGTGLSPGSGPERSASGGAAAAAGRAGKAVSGARGAAGGTRGRWPAGGSAPASPREPPWSTSFRGSARHSAGGRPARPALVSGPALGAARPRLRVLRPVQPRGRLVFIYLPDRLYGAGDTVADRGVPSRGPPSGGEEARNEINRPVEF